MLHDYTLYCMYTHIFAYLSIISVVLTIPLTSRLCLAVDYHGLSWIIMDCPWLVRGLFVSWLAARRLAWLSSGLSCHGGQRVTSCLYGCSHHARSTHAPRYGHAAHTTGNTTGNTTGSQPFPATSRSVHLQICPAQPSPAQHSLPDTPVHVAARKKEPAPVLAPPPTAKHKNKRPGTRHPHRHSTPGGTDSQAASTENAPGQIQPDPIHTDKQIQRKQSTLLRNT